MPGRLKEGNLLMTAKANHPYEEEGYEALCEVGDQMEADLLLDELDGADIDALQYPGSSETMLSFPPAETSGGIQILVKREQLAEAQALYEQLQSGEVDEEEGGEEESF